MKENRYDDKEFFLAYSRMMRSEKGLEGAGEWPELERHLPDFSGKRVLDLGCGYGWHDAHAVQHGAEYVLATDISSRMLERAMEINSNSAIEYRRGAMEDLELPDSSFDIVISSLAFHYISDFPSMARKVHRWLRPGGAFVFSAEHPVFTAEGSQDWCYGEDGDIKHFPVDNYFYEGRRDAVFLGQHVVKYHRTLTTYVRSLLSAGFRILDIAEPQPPESMMELDGMKDEMRRPMMIIFSAIKE